MTRAWAVAITTLSLLGVLALVGLVVWVGVVWGPFPFIVAEGALIAGFAIWGIVVLAKSIYRRLMVSK